jgi:hypothetical protein
MSASWRGFSNPRQGKICKFKMNYRDKEFRARSRWFVFLIDSISPGVWASSSRSLTSKISINRSVLSSESDSSLSSTLACNFICWGITNQRQNPVTFPIPSSV